MRFLPPPCHRLRLLILVRIAYHKAITNFNSQLFISIPVSHNATVICRSRPRLFNSCFPYFKMGQLLSCGTCPCLMPCYLFAGVNLLISWDLGRQYHSDISHAHTYTGRQPIGNPQADCLKVENLCTLKVCLQ